MAMTRSLPTMSENQKRKRKRITPTSVVKYQPAAAGLQRYLKLRGTPKGVYEINRTANISIPITVDGFYNGVAASSDLCFTWTPQYMYVYNGVGTTLFTAAVPNAAEISALWDDIKIDKVELTLMGAFTQSTTGNTTAPRQIIYGTDDNDKTVNAAIVQQLGDCTVWNPSMASTSQRVIVIKPKFNSLIYYTSTLSGYKADRGYIRSDYDIEHYALKLHMPANLSGPQPTGNMNVACKFFFKCKNLK